MNKTNMEIRTYCREVRAAPASENGELRFEGYAAVFNSFSEDMGGFREMILPGAFSSIADDDVRCLMNHDPNYVLGRKKAGTLKLEQDERGLRFEVVAPDAAWARDLYTSVQRGDIDQCSFAFSVKPDGEAWKSTPAGDERVLSSVRLYDVSIVTYPAYQATVAATRSTEETYRQRPVSAGKTDILRRKIALMEGKDHE